MIMTTEENLPPAVRKEIKQNYSKYFKISQLAFYSSLDKISASQIFTKSSCDVQCNIIFCFDGQKYNSSSKKQLELFIIRTLDEQIPKMKKEFSIAYVHHEGVGAFSFLKGVINILPEKYLGKLKKLYVVNAGAIVKIVSKFSFGAVNSYLMNKVEHLQSVDQIQQANKIILGGNISKSKLGLSGGTNKQKVEYVITQEQDLSVLKIIRNKLYGKQLEEYDVNDVNGIPIIINTIVGIMLGNEQFLMMEGIMRKSCNVEELEILQNQIMKSENYKKFIRQFDDAYVICGCLKKIFNNLYSPLFSYSLYDKVLTYQHTGELENQITFIRSLLDQMKQEHRHVLSFMIAFLKEGIIKHMESNKMTAYNLAVVFGPCFFRPKAYSLEDLVSSGKFSSIILLLLNNFAEIVGEEEYHKYVQMLDEAKNQFY